MSRRPIAGCGVVLLLVLVVGGLLIWAFRGELLRRWGAAPDYVEVSPEAAASAEAKLERLRAHGETVRLSPVELASVLRYRLPEEYAEVLQNPSVAMRGDSVSIGARVPTTSLPELSELDRVRGLLPDTTRIDFTGRLIPFGPRRSALEIEEVGVAGIPIPERFYPDVLARLGRRDEPGLAPNAVAVSLPEGVGSARVENGQLVLTP